MKIKTLALLTLAAAMPAAHAMDDRLYVVPSVNYTFTDSDRRAEDGWGAGFSLGKPIGRNLNMELSLTGSSFDFDNGSGDYDLVGLGVDALYLFNREADFTPYGVFGLGVLRTDVPGSNDSGLMANVGLGVMKRLTDNIGLRADARYRWDGNSTNAFGENHFGDWLLSVGVSIALGQKPQPAPKPEPVAQPAPPPAPVAPPPAPAPVVQPAPAAAPAPLALKTEQAAQLEKAQPGDVVVILQGVNFEFDSAKLRPDAIVILDEAVTVLQKRKDIAVDIVGHTCNIGTEQYNQRLSERRAKAVYDYFVGKGIAAERLTSKGMGETQPAYSNATREGRAKNRRVELHVK